MMPAPKTTKLALPSTADSSQPWFPWLSTIIGLFGLLMMVAATAGGYFGARWSKALPVAWVRRGVIATGLVMSAVFFSRL